MRRVTRNILYKNKVNKSSNINSKKKSKERQVLL